MKCNIKMCVWHLPSSDSHCGCKGVESVEECKGRIEAVKANGKTQSLKAALAQQKRELVEMTKERDSWKGAAIVLREACDESTRLNGLIVRLGKYAKHPYECKAPLETARDRQPLPCTCGLSDLLKEAKDVE